MIVDLFAGPGGWDLGLGVLGQEDAIGIENDPSACATRAAAGLPTIRADVTTIDPGLFAGKLDGLIASPPCTDFSAAGLRAGITGGTGKLMHEVPRWVEAARPRWVACEQVPPAREWWEAFALAFRAWGYRTWVGVLNAADYGVPQTRQRAFLLAHLDRSPIPPNATHDRNPQPSLFGTELEKWVSMAEALGWTGNDAPARTVAGHRAPRWMYEDRDGTRGRMVVNTRGERTTPGGNEFDGADQPSWALTEKARSWKVRTGNFTAKSRDLDGERSAAGSEPYERDIDEPSPTITNAQRWVVNTGRDWHDDGQGRAGAQERSVAEPAPSIDGKGRWHLHEIQENGADRDMDDPAMTITASADNGNFRFDYVHEPNDPDWPTKRPATTLAGDPRIPQPGHKSDTPYPDAPGRMHGAIRLDIVHALILQSFPHDYPVQGTKTQKFAQVGNAVPPLFAAAVLSAVV